MKHDIHAPMNRARELYVRAVTQSERNSLAVAEQRLREVGESQAPIRTYQTAQRWYDESASALGHAEQAAGAHFDAYVCGADAP